MYNFNTFTIFEMIWKDGSTTYYSYHLSKVHASRFMSMLNTPNGNLSITGHYRRVPEWVYVTLLRREDNGVRIHKQLTADANQLFSNHCIVNQVILTLFTTLIGPTAKTK